MCFLFVMMFLVGSFGVTYSAINDTPPPSPDSGLMFDDFSYVASDDPQLAAHGWVVRAGDGWPGIPGAEWRADNVTFVPDPDDPANTLLVMTSTTDGTTTTQTQLCHQRKYFEGTFAARVRFSDAPITGPDGDQVVQTLYLISPQAFPMDPDYSELDFEYLPNGGWGTAGSVLHATTWETFQLDPWIADNQTGSLSGSWEGWHTLYVNIVDGTATYYVDGLLLAQHGGAFYPEVPMSLNFNLWFIQGGQIASREARAYVQQIDWVLARPDVLLTLGEVEGLVEAFRRAEVIFRDTVPPWNPPLETPCNF
ncbi:MAG: glycoside hydrolase family 16 protein [bacterium]|nr:glycoside hydrolase family 16 protein [bacterium]